MPKRPSHRFELILIILDDRSSFGCLPIHVLSCKLKTTFDWLYVIVESFIVQNNKNTTWFDD